MARADLSALLAVSEETPAPSTTPAEPAPVEPASTPERPTTAPAGYETFARKEARLREDQVADLAVHARRLNRVKSDKGTERITENTLLRIGADWVLAHIDELSGNTEAELRKSVGL